MKPGHVTQACLCSQTNRAEDCAFTTEPMLSCQQCLASHKLTWLASTGFSRSIRCRRR